MFKQQNAKNIIRSIQNNEKRALNVNQPLIKMKSFTDIHLRCHWFWLHVVFLWFDRMGWRHLRKYLSRSIVSLGRSGHYSGGSGRNHRPECHKDSGKFFKSSLKIERSKFAIFVFVSSLGISFNLVGMSSTRAPET